MKRFTKVLCVALVFGLLFAGLVFAEGEEGEAETEDPASQTEPAEEESPPERELRSDYDSTYLWIGLKYGSDAVDKITLKSTDGFLIVKGNNKGWKETDVTTDSKTLTIVPSGGYATLVDESGDTILGSMGNGGYIVMSAAEDPEDRLITINGSRYRDGATATVTNGKLNVTNVIEIEHYVRGVVANEMGYTYPIEALKAQAIAARSYAFRNINKHKNYGIDLCTTQDCQVYRGYVSEHDSTDDACSQTEGKVLTYDGKIVEAYYYAYSGGATLNSEDVWVNALDYCRGKVDEYYSDYKWAVHYTMDELTEEMESRGKDIGDVVSVQVTNRHNTGAVAEVTFVGTKGTAKFTKSTILSVLGLKSFMFAINDSQFVWSKDGQAIVTDAKVNVLGANSTGEDLSTVYVIGADGDVAKSAASDIRITNGTMVAMPEGSVSAGWRDDPVRSDVVYIAGSGWGHGVGMPQTSARNMADLGFDCEAILQYYYEGTEIGDLADFQ
ncbi:MAG: SpoIID/LytB domain-containing protein [Firmicutes bacterium]|nr:SpoIID/LytB domain-containing protein [Bacillota bacterium]